MIQGYMIDVEYDGTTLVAKGRNKAAHFALVGASVRRDLSGVDVPDEVRITAADIASLDFRKGNPVTNGNLVIHTTTGQKYQLHFRRKSNDEFAALAEQLRAAIVEE